MPEARLSVEPRGLLGKRVGRLRRRGVLPAVVFGHGPSIPIQVEERAFAHGYRSWGRTTLITLTGLDGDIPALVHDIARDPRSGKLLHADFFRVSLTRKVRAEVPIHFVGEAPAVKNLSAVLLHARDHLRVEAFPQDIPRRIDVDIAVLETMDDVVYVRDVHVDAAKVELLDDQNSIVVKVVPQRVEEIPVPAPAEAVAPEAEAAAAEGEPGAEQPPGAPATAQQPQQQQQQPQQQQKK